jgi:ectoine hydroxylase-related dioxygenase (phytanoyl-CoA dioxygenase family)
MDRSSTLQPAAEVTHDAATVADRLAANGFVILRDVVPLRVIAAARDAFEPLLAEAQRQGPNRGAHRYSVAFPLAAPFDDPLLYANPAILAVLSRVLGDDLAIAGVGSADCEPGSSYQPVHRDEPADLYREAPGLSLPTYAVCVNIPLGDVHPDDGPMELWPGGTHCLPLPDRLEQVAARMPSVRATITAGSVLLRDIRTWHRGTPNRSAAARSMLGYAYVRSWFRYHTCAPPRISAARWATLPQPERRLLRHAEIVA